MLGPLQLLTIWGAFFIGVVLADSFKVETKFYIVLLVSALVLGWCWRRSVLFLPALSLTVCLCVLSLLLGVVRMEYAERTFTGTSFTDQIGQSVELTGTVVREPDERETFTQVYIEVSDELVLVRTDRFTSVQYGDRVNVRGQLEQPEVFETDTGRIFNYPGYLKVRGVQYIVSFADVAVESSGHGYWLLDTLYEVKEKFAEAITAAMPPPQSDLGLGLLLGIKQALGDDLETAFRRTGLIHIVVLSGYNVMLVIGFFWWATSWFLPLRGRVLVSLLGIILFALLVGLSATVVRASVMAIILLLAKWIGEQYDVVRALLFAGFVMVLISPYVLQYDLGFQLSFLATLGLVLFVPLFESTVVTDTSDVGLKDIFLATTVTNIFVLPLLMYSIGEVSVVSIVVNVLVLPVVALAMAGTFATGMAAMLHPIIAIPFAFVTNLFLSYIILIVTWFDTLPWAAVIVPPISFFEMSLMYILIGSGWYVWNQTKTEKVRHKVISKSPDTTSVSGDYVPLYFR